MAFVEVDIKKSYTFLNINQKMRSRLFQETAFTCLTLKISNLNPPFLIFGWFSGIPLML